MGEHLPCKQGVRGSNPLISTPKSSSVTHLENRIYDNLAEHELQAEKRKFVHTKNRKPQK